MIRYKVIQDNRAESKNRGKWYARASHELLEFDELGIFRIGLKTKPADTAKDFNAAKHVVGCRMNLRLGKRFLAANLSKDMRLREADFYNPLDEDEDDGN